MNVAAGSLSLVSSVVCLYDRAGACVIIHAPTDAARERAEQTRDRIIRHGGRIADRDPRPLLALAPKQVADAAQRVLAAGGVVLGAMYASAVAKTTCRFTEGAYPVLEMPRP